MKLLGQSGSRQLFSSSSEIEQGEPILLLMESDSPFPLSPIWQQGY